MVGLKGLPREGFIEFLGVFWGLRFFEVIRFLSQHGLQAQGCFAAAKKESACGGLSESLAWRRDSRAFWFKPGSARGPEHPRLHKSIAVMSCSPSGDYSLKLLMPSAGSRRRNKKEEGRRKKR